MNALIDQCTVLEELTTSTVHVKHECHSCKKVSNVGNEKKRMFIESCLAGRSIKDLMVNPGNVDIEKTCPDCSKGSKAISGECYISISFF